MPRCHDVISIANARFRLRLRAARNRIVLTNLVPVPNPQIAAPAIERFVQRIGPQHSAGGDLILVPERGPALHVNIRFEQTPRANDHIGFNHAIFANARARPNHRARIDARGRCRISCFVAASHQC